MIINTKSKYESPLYPIVSPNQMTRKELCNWFAFCNALKFINLKEKETGEKIESINIDTRALTYYTHEVSGDIQTSLREKGGIPMKYSLDASIEEAKITDEIMYNA